MKNNTITHCNLPWSYLYLRYGGRIQPCCQNSTELGNINDDNFVFDEVWNGKTLQNIRKLISENKYEQAGCSPDCNILHSLKHEGTINLFDTHMLEMSEKNSFFKSNFLKLNNDILTKKTKVSNMPIQLDIQPLEACNMACTMCHQNHSNPTKLDVKTIEKIITPNLKTIYSISFQGGEVFVDSNYKELLIKLKSNIQSYQKIKVISNGSLLSTNDLDRMTEGNNPINFSISADGVNEQTFKKIRKSSHFNKVMKNIEYLAQLQEKKEIHILIWNFVVMKSNFFEIKELIHTSARLKITINVQTIIGEYKDENIFQYKLIDKKASLKYISEAIALSDDLKADILGLDVIKQKLEKL